MSIQKHTIVWEGIEIELTYDPAAWGGVIAHLEVRSINPDCAPLPITETGYLSHYHPCGTVEENKGTLAEQVTGWLDKEAKSKTWKMYLEDCRQLRLF
ncbi:hypothetical protein [Algicella marina]|uniref:Uncharacterized protein n=1 Tax=Algicella marina TaxID=2683284 RepID=A0A6P1T3Y4_9RHOB|nr:hypothetical protein [Algicella marina]QHQ35232.1 hypothetical protein GO499_08480 [Algicella marina]